MREIINCRCCCLVAWLQDETRLFVETLDESLAERARQQAGSPPIHLPGGLGLGPAFAGPPQCYCRAPGSRPSAIDLMTWHRAQPMILQVVAADARSSYKFTFPALPATALSSMVFARTPCEH